MKKVFAFGLALAMTASLTACGGSSSTSSTRVQCCTQCRKPELRSGAFRRKGFRPLRKYPERNRSPVAVPDCRI